MSRHAIGSRAAVGQALAAAALVTLAACGGGARGGGQESTAVCPAIDGAEFAVAIDRYLDGLDPAPARFLVYSAGDSALPDGARSELESKGPTYLFPTDPALQTKQLASLQAKGAFTTMLVLYLGDQHDGKRATIRLTARYMDKDNTNAVAPVKSITFECRDRRWQAAAADTSHSA